MCRDVRLKNIEFASWLASYCEISRRNCEKPYLHACMGQGISTRGRSDAGMTRVIRHGYKRKTTLADLSFFSVEARVWKNKYMHKAKSTWLQACLAMHWKAGVSANAWLARKDLTTMHLLKTCTQACSRAGHRMQAADRIYWRKKHHTNQTAHDVFF